MIREPWKISVIIGNMVPQNVVTAMDSRRRLLRRNPASFDAIAVIGMGDRSCGSLYRNNVVEMTRRAATKMKNNGPMSERANECTDDRTPLLTTKVPNTANAYDSRTKPMVQALSWPRRS